MERDGVGVVDPFQNVEIYVQSDDEISWSAKETLVEDEWPMATVGFWDSVSGACFRRVIFKMDEATALLRCLSTNVCPNPEHTVFDGFSVSVGFSRVNVHYLNEVNVCTPYDPLSVEPDVT